MKKIYLAGPLVFYPQAKEIYARLEALCFKHGVLGVRPYDVEANEAGQPADKHQAMRIFRENMARVDQCDGVVACLDSFRSPVEPDSGTVFEVGAAYAKGMPVAGWLKDAYLTYPERLVQSGAVLAYKSADLILDEQHNIVENFGYPLNLMLSCSCDIFDEPENAIRAVAAKLLKAA